MRRTTGRGECVDGYRIDHHEPVGQMLADRTYHVRGPLAPQYAALETLQKTYGDRGFTVLGVPSNQFLQELSSEEKIAEYCSTMWGVTFPMTEKAKVNGKKRHPLYAELVQAPDEHGVAGPVTWNFEKFLVLPSGEVHRFRPNVKPDAPEIVELIEANLPG